MRRHRESAVSNVYLQCSQETAVLDAEQLGDIRAVVPATYEPQAFENADQFLADYEQTESRRIPTAPLAEIDLKGDIAAHFDSAIHTATAEPQQDPRSPRPHGVGGLPRV